MREGSFKTRGAESWSSLSNSAHFQWDCGEGEGKARRPQCAGLENSEGGRARRPCIHQRGGLAGGHAGKVEGDGTQAGPAAGKTAPSSRADPRLQLSAINNRWHLPDLKDFAWTPPIHPPRRRLSCPFKDEEMEAGSQK